MRQHIDRVLRDYFNPEFLEVIDESAKHAGHKGVKGASGNTHFRIIIAAESLGPLSRIEAHRTIMNLIFENVSRDIHSISIEIR